MLHLSIEAILLLLFWILFTLNKMLVEIKSKFSEEIFEGKMPLRAENSAKRETALAHIHGSFLKKRIDCYIRHNHRIRGTLN